MAKNLQNKVALVTGGSRGIGAAIAKRLAKDGANVAISYVSSADKANALVKELEKEGVKAIAFKADQADAKQVSKLVKDVAKHFGKLDILVNNAGIFITGAVADRAANAAEFERQHAINVGGVIAAVEAAANIIGDNGRIITIGSVVAIRSPFPGLTDYSATKAAVAAYSRGWAHDFAPRAITVNTVQPGPIDTDLNPDEGEFAEHMKQGIPLKRYGKVEEVAAAVAFLASPEASYITGTSITVDGGFSA